MGSKELNAQAIADLQAAWDIVFQQGALLAEFPIEGWLAAFSYAESIAPILDPTLSRDYMYSGKGEVIKDVLSAALVFKQAILKARKQVEENPRLRDTKQ